jgi:hypothetical protein
MAQLEFPRQKAIILAFILILVLYLLLLPVWMRMQMPYGRLVAAVSSLILSGSGVGSVHMTSHGTTTYILRDPQSGGWGRINQRLLSVPDLPLAIAVTLGMTFLTWTRRSMLALAAILCLFLIHIALTCVTAFRLHGVLAGPRLSSSELDGKLHGTAEAVGSYRDIAPIAVLFLIVLLLVTSYLIQRAPSGKNQDSTIVLNVDKPPKRI